MEELLIYIAYRGKKYKKRKKRKKNGDSPFLENGL
jgi:hypothetical protein